MMEGVRTRTECNVGKPVNGSENWKILALPRGGHLRKLH